MKAMKKLFLMAAMLLTGVCAFAQDNNPIKGDVNGDGKVDVADIVAIIEIMKNGGGTSSETASYYYVGTTKPTSSMTIPGDGWNVIEQGSNQIVVNSEFLVPDRTWYIAIPHSYGYQAYDTTGAETEPNAYNVSQMTINNILYDLFTTANAAYSVYNIFKV